MSDFFSTKPIMLNDGTRLLRVTPEQITYFEGKQMHCIMHTIDGKQVTLSQPLGKATAELPNPYFVRINRSVVVNTHHIYKVMGKKVYVDNKPSVIFIGDTYTGCLDNAFCVLSELYED